MTVLAAACVVWALRAMSAVQGDLVTVTVDGEIYGTYSLYDSRTVEIIQKDENSRNRVTNVIVIEKGTVRMESADCPDQLCVKQGRIRRKGECIICLPNRVTVSVEGGEEHEYDAIAG